MISLLPLLYTPNPQAVTSHNPMAQEHMLPVVNQRAVGPQLNWLTLETPHLARSAHPGQYLLVRCAPPGSYDPLLRRALFIAAAEPALGQIGLLYAPDERGLAWLAQRRAGQVIDTLGPFGQPFTLGRRTRNLLLLGQGAGLAALLLLAQQATARGCAVTLLLAAEEAARLPPFVLPGEVELQIVDFTLQIADETTQSTTYDPSTLRLRSGPASLRTSLQSAIQWADQLCAALPASQLSALRNAIRAGKLRWERGFASVLLDGPLVCGVGACGVCAVATRRGPRWLCSDGPVFDVRDLAEH